MRALSRIWGFRRLLGVRLSSQFGDGLFQASLASSILFNPAQQTSSIKIATGFALLVVPFSILGPFAGVFLDRWSRRNVIYVANLIRFVIALPAAFLMYAKGPTGLFFFGVLLVTAVNRFFLAGVSAAQPHVVPKELLVTANAMSSTLGTAVYSLGLGATALALKTFLNSGQPRLRVVRDGRVVGYLTAALLARSSFHPKALGPDAALARRGSPWSEVGVVARGMVAGAAAFHL